MLAVDRRALLLARTRGHANRALERTIRDFSRTGEHGACWFALGGVGLLSSHAADSRCAWRRGLEATALAYGLNYAVKLTVRRPRPRLEGLPPLSGVVSNLSFPSAHATTAFAAAGMYSRALPQGRALIYAGAAALAASRPYLGVHYPSDVVAGALLGAVIARVWPQA